jgi:hypothetical protein
VLSRANIQRDMLTKDVEKASTDFTADGTKFDIVAAAAVRL